MYLNPCSLFMPTPVEILRCVDTAITRGTVRQEGQGVLTAFGTSSMEGWAGADVFSEELPYLTSVLGGEISRTYDHTNDDHGAIMEFDYLAASGSKAVLKVDGYELDLQAAADSGTSSGVSEDGIAWEIDGTTSADLNGTSAEAVSFRIYLPESRMDDSGAIDVTFDGQGAAYGIDNWLIEDATATDVVPAMLNSDEKGVLSGSLEKLTITDNTLAAQDLAGTWDSLSTKLALATGLSGTIKDIDNQAKDQGFSALTDAELTDLANKAISALSGWASDSGFQDWTNKLWSSVDREYSEGNYDSFLFGMGGVASSLFFVQNFAAGNVFATLGSTFLGAVNYLNAVKEQNPNIALPEGTPDFDMTSVLSALADELQLRDITASDGTGLEVKLRDAVGDGYAAFEQFMVNSQAVSLVSDLYANGEQGRVFADNEIDTMDFEEFEELGFDVDVTYREKTDFVGFDPIYVDEYTVTLTSDDNTLYNGSNDIRFVMDDLRNNNFDVVDFEFV